MKPVSHLKLSIPNDYVCINCGKSGVKLWRVYTAPKNFWRFRKGYGCFHKLLYCVTCVEKDQKSKHKLDLPYPEYSDRIGKYVPAIPTEDGISYWMYSKIPAEGKKWWESLPLERSVNEKIR